MTTPIVPSITDGQLAELESSYEHAYCTIPGSLIAALVIRLRCAEKDAARYRWLRDSGYLYSWTDLHVCDEHRSAEITDQTIDSAMEQSK